MKYASLKTSGYRNAFSYSLYPHISSAGSKPKCMNDTSRVPNQPHVLSASSHQTASGTFSFTHYLVRRVLYSLDNVCINTQTQKSLYVRRLPR